MPEQRAEQVVSTEQRSLFLPALLAGVDGGLRVPPIVTAAVVAVGAGIWSGAGARPILTVAMVS
ncbi:MAG: hypothetical protein M3440_12580, partial [Chloroflexota bacterium]|nr:hypothetical protein [Chloroflexota bacterium]